MQKTIAIESILNLICRTFKLPTIRSLKNQIKKQNDLIGKNNDQQRALYRVISKIRASLDLETIFRTTTKETCKLLHVERVAVYQFSEDWGGTFVSDFEFAAPNWSDLEPLGKNTVWNDSYLQDNQGGRYKNNESLVVADIRNANFSQCHIDLLEQFHIRAYATAPIFIGQKLWGVLAAYQHSNSRQWKESEVQFLSQVAGHLGFAVQQAQLLTEIQRQAIDLKECNHQQQILFDLITEVRESLDLDVLFKTTTREVRKALRVDRVGIFKFHQESKYYCGRYYCGRFVAENVLPQYDSAMDIKITDRCFAENYAVAYEQGRMQVIENVDESGLAECHVSILKRFQVKAQVITPLIKGGKLWGLLCIHQCSNTRIWKTSEVYFIQQLASHFNVALNHADLLHQSQVQSDELAKTVAALESANQQLEQLTRMDALTLVANRRSFDELLQQEWRRLARSQRYLSLILFDIDHFKAYNDYYGHLAGDQCLIQVAQTARSVLKRPTDLLARYGGEEFAIILPETDCEGAIQIAQEIQNSLESLRIEHLGIACDRGYVTISQGIASQIPNPGQACQDLILRADQALYVAKDKGRNTWSIAEPEHCTAGLNPNDTTSQEAGVMVATPALGCFD